MGMIFPASKDRIARFQEALALACDEFLLFKLNKEIETYNLDLCNVAIEPIAQHQLTACLYIDKNNRTYPLYETFK